jgi:hypothetical protein
MPHNLLVLCLFILVVLRSSALFRGLFDARGLSETTPLANGGSFPNDLAQTIVVIVTGGTDLSDGGVVPASSGGHLRALHVVCCAFLRIDIKLWLLLTVLVGAQILASHCQSKVIYRTPKGPTWRSLESGL